jgi:glutamine synthetase
MTAIDEPPIGVKPSTPTFAVPPDYAPDPRQLAAVKAKLQDAGVKYCFASYVDVHGVPKAKATPIDAFEKMCKGSELFTVGAMEGMGLVGPQEDECAAVPDLDTCTVFPWDNRYAFFFGSLYYHGEPYANDSRVILQRQVQRAGAMGLTFNLGFEPEFYVLRKTDPTQQNGTSLVKGYDRISRSVFKGTCPAYDVNLTVECMDFLEPIVKYVRELGWGMYSFDQEGGHSQFELDFGYTDVLSSADRLVFLRLMAKQVAQSLGYIASFMPKPFANDFRCGAHFNMSIADARTGENLFAPEEGGNPFIEKHGMPLSKMAYHFTAGLLKHAAALTAVTCPTYNSYQGLIAQGDMLDISWAPVLITYGKNNRSAMLRFPPNRYCVENRTPDMSCNPYLAAAMTLAAGLEGIEKELDPGTPLNDNCYDLKPADLEARGVHMLPRTLLHAIDAFEADPLVEEALGDEFKGIYVQQKRREWEHGFYRVTDEQRDRYLTFI